MTQGATLPKKKVLLLGASGLIGPFLTPGLVDDYDLKLADVKAHPDGVEVEYVDVTDYAQVRAAAEGTEAIMNFTVNRSDADLSFHVNTRGAWNVMRAAAELGIGKVVHSGPQVHRQANDHDFDIDDPPGAPGTGLYSCSKMLSREICRSFALAHDIQVVCFLFNGLHPAVEEPLIERDIPPFTVVWEDLHLACKQALEVESVPGNYQEFNLHSHLGQEKYLVDKARRLLGFEPVRNVAAMYRRPVEGV
ncbi:MAG: NAD-dependent epimerase/dehydratase family protein [Gemmatimonadetes bacterium]|nr:NAD-dependent epimerase/dehydratase family protein [Gemmatimonadota bacterium]MBT6149993.1 NAD-dependent epimerase/dehydratase family protein [Gemmatimonadota bacterium]MBT7858790.1 NAD-dependent epimerase/dehydratase family protein [Gemmatimonadota bacterium]